MLSFRDTIKLPVVFVNKARFKRLSGHIEIRPPIKTGMVVIDANHSEMITPLTSIPYVKGFIIYTGSMQIGFKCLLRVERMIKLLKCDRCQL